MVDRQYEGANVDEMPRPTVYIPCIMYETTILTFMKVACPVMTTLVIIVRKCQVSSFLGG